MISRDPGTIKYHTPSTNAASHFLLHPLSLPIILPSASLARFSLIYAIIIMFPFYPNTTNDPAFFISSANFQQEADTNIIPQDPLFDHHPQQNQVNEFTSFIPNIITTSNSESNFVPIREAFGYNLGDNKKEDDQDGKKKMHRDLERQRRKEMNSLYANLRTLIPLEHVKVVEEGNFTSCFVKF